MSSFDEYIASFDVDPGYLDWAKFGPLSPLVRADVTADAELLGSGRPSSISLVTEHVAEVAELLAPNLGVSPDQVVLQPSSSHGLQQAIYGIREGGVLVSRAEFPAITVPIQRAADFTGRITAQFFDAPETFVTADAIRDELTEETTAVAVSLVDFRTGYRADLTSIRDVIGPDRLFIVDAVQGFGIQHADWAAADVIVGHGYKWLRAGRGTGFSSFSTRALERLQPVLSGYTATMGGMVLDEVGRPADGAAAFASSSPDMLAAARLATAIGEINAAGIDAIEAAIIDRTTRVIALADDNEIPVITPRASERRGGIVTLAPAPAEVARLSAELANSGIAVTSRGDTVRIATHAGTNDDSLRMLGDALASFAQSRAW